MTNSRAEMPQNCQFHCTDCRQIYQRENHCCTYFSETVACACKLNNNNFRCLSLWPVNGASSTLNTKLLSNTPLPLKVRKVTTAWDKSTSNYLSISPISLCHVKRSCHWAPLHFLLWRYTSFIVVLDCCIAINQLIIITTIIITIRASNIVSNYRKSTSGVL